MTDFIEVKHFICEIVTSIFAPSKELVKVTRARRLQEQVVNNLKVNLGKLEAAI